MCWVLRLLVPGGQAVLSERVFRTEWRTKEIISPVPLLREWEGSVCRP